MATAAAASMAAIPNGERRDSKSPPGERHDSKSLRGNGGTATVADSNDLSGASAAVVAGGGSNDNGDRRGGTLTGKGQ